MTVANTTPLKDWASIEGDYKDAALLVGNGLSINIWPEFDYPSLLERAKEIKPGLDDRDEALFSAFETTNFETVLSSLRTTRVVDGVLGKEVAEVAQRYTKIRQAVFHAVHAVHVPWAKVDNRREHIRDALLKYKGVFSLNYDLIVYWSINPGAAPFKDGFWGEGSCFDSDDAEFSSDSVPCWYLHGGLHLERIGDGRTHKRVNAGEGSLLDTFGKDSLDDTVPLFVSEGEVKDKQRAIANSDYLASAHRALDLWRGPIVVFGASLERDGHVVKAIHRPHRRLAVSVHATGDAEQAVLDYKQRLGSGMQIEFFDSATHPLGSAELANTGA